MKEQPYTTISALKAHKFYNYGLETLYKVLGKYYPEDKPIYFIDMLDITEIFYITWAFRTAPEYRDIWVKFARECAKQARRYAREAYDTPACTHDYSTNYEALAADRAEAAAAFVVRATTRAIRAHHAARYARIAADEALDAGETAGDEQKEMLRKLLTETA